MPISFLELFNVIVILGQRKMLVSEVIADCISPVGLTCWRNCEGDLLTVDHFDISADGSKCQTFLLSLDPKVIGG